MAALVTSNRTSVTRNVAPDIASATVRERHDQEKCEQDLDSRERDPDLVQELDQLPVEPFFLAFAGAHARLVPRYPYSEKTPYCLPLCIV